MSYKPEVLAEGRWSSNGLAFETEDEALRYGDDLLMRWFVPTDRRAVLSNDPVNYKLTDDGRLEAVSSN